MYIGLFMPIVRGFTAWIKRKMCRIVSRIYFRHFFHQDDVIRFFIVHFMPENVSGANPHFFVTLVSNQAKSKKWEARVQIEPSGYRIAYIREDEYI